METLDITMLIGLVLMVSALVILYRCARGKSRRQRMNELADTLLSIHDSFELQVRRLETLSGEIASDNEKCSSLQYRAGQLQDTVDSLEYRRDELDRENLSLARTHDELMRSNTDLTEKAARLRDAIVQDGQGRLGDCRGEQTGGRNTLPLAAAIQPGHPAIGTEPPHRIRVKVCGRSGAS